MRFLLVACLACAACYPELLLAGQDKRIVFSQEAVDKAIKRGVEGLTVYGPRGHGAGGFCEDCPPPNRPQWVIALVR